MRRVLFLLSLLLMNVCMLSAQTIKGKISDKKTKKPVEQALVRAFSEKDELVSYTYTDEHGVFSIAKNNSITKINISCLGYESIVLPFAEFEKHTHIYLNEGLFNLREAVVTSKRIEKKNDTIVYSVAGFAMPQDKSIADVLAKMPGIEVKTDGRIEYNGSLINKFYVENMDLMNDKYTLISNNLDRKKVKKVEILQNHQAISVLRGKKFSEQAAINLVLEDNAKLNWTGTIDIGFGYNEKEHLLLHDNRLLAMIFGKKKQHFSIYKSNDTGKNIASEIYDVIYQRQRSLGEEPGILSGFSFGIPHLSSDRYTYNQSHLFASNHLQRVRKNTDLRTQVSYFYDDKSGYSELVTDYLLSADSIYSTRESYHTQKIQNRIEASIGYELNSNKCFVKNNLKSSFAWQKDKSNLYLNGRSMDMYVVPDKQYLQNDLELIFPISSLRTLSITSVNAYNRMPQELSTINGGVQRVEYGSFGSFSSMEMKNKIGGFYFKNKIGFEYYRQSLETSLMQFSGKTEYVGENKLRKILPSFASGITIKRGDVQWEADILLKWWNLNTSIGEKSVLLPEWRAYIHYDLNAMSSCSFTYRHQQTFMDLRRMYHIPYFSGYRNMTIGNSLIDNTPSHSFSFYYTYTHPVKGLFFSGSLRSDFTQKKSVLKSEVMDGNIFLTTVVPADYMRKSTQVNARISKSNSWWKSIFALSGSYSYTKDKRLRLDALSDMSQKTFVGVFSSSLRPAYWLSVDWESRGTHHRITGEGIRSKTTNLQHKLGLHFVLSKSLSLSLKNNLMQYLELNKKVFFADAVLAFKQKRFELELVASNLLGKKTFVQDIITFDYSVINRTVIRPREIMVKVAFGY